MNLTRDAILKFKAAKRHDLILVAYINESGYAGCLPTGEIVDRRHFPEATPVQENTLLDIPKPKKLP
jgi:hypothetical protein